MPLFGQKKPIEKHKKSLYLGIFCVISKLFDNRLPALHTRPVIGSNPIAATKEAGHPFGCPAFLRDWIRTGAVVNGAPVGLQSRTPTKPAGANRIQSSSPYYDVYFIQGNHLSFCTRTILKAIFAKTFFFRQGS